ncbi:uncharacterized protein N7479_010715 [Penicillium vulpinum]|uniref:Quinate repressor protein n=1 Tax=Penicillium vulpinum TaxID=29845 RepID=A0A1V6S8I4_9EURO|nr:uncharacterized protein N7479_010715 [Penicillium vulpinum]KAJ5952302.1 hypothetical protein N7479_010715 [Penicillium vulpinum]OQE10352.1 hypothetical protein PENVUL_c004G08470 [Penicillium vulpinum]
MSAPQPPSSSRTPGPHPEGPGSRRYSADATILLVGFFGAGKKTLGLIASVALRRCFVDFDSFFRDQIHCSPQEFIAEHGFRRYREVETEVSRDVLTKYQTGCVIAGLGFAASPTQRQLLGAFAQNHPVVYVRRSKADLQHFIRIPSNNFDHIFELENAFFESCSNFDFFNITQEPNQQTKSQIHAPLKLKEVERIFVAFLYRIFGDPHKQLFSADAFSATHTYALDLSLKQLETDLDTEFLDAGADAIKLTLNHEEYSHGEISVRLPRCMTILRKHTRVPIILDAQTDPEKDSTGYLKFLETVALRVAPDAFTCMLQNKDTVRRIHATKGHSRMIALYQQMGPLGVDMLPSEIPNLRIWLEDLGFEALCITGQHAVAGDALACVAFRQMLTSALNIPVIAYNTDPEERASILLNPTLSPIRVSPGQDQIYSLRDMQHALSSFSLRPSKLFKIVGQDLRHSLSPAMHNAAYAACGLPHKYDYDEIQTFHEIEVILKTPSFDDFLGGLIISLPFKNDILPLLDETSPDARDINAVNTVVLEYKLQPNGVRTPFYRGYNTDYTGIKDCVHSHLSPANAIRGGSTALIIGAGGMAHAAVYACYQLGVRQVFVYNRTLSNAQKLARYYNVWARSKGDNIFHLHVLQSTEDRWPSDFRLPTIVISCIPGRHVGTQLPVLFQVSGTWLESRTGGVFVEVGYGPSKTSLMEQMTQWSMKGWIIVDGLKVLVKQGITQYELFTQRPAPVHVMRRAVQEEAIKKGYFHMW